MEHGGVARDAAATRAFARDGLTVFVGNLVARGLGFLFPVVLAWTLPEESFALAYFYVAAGFLIGELALVGMPTALTRALAAGLPGPGRWSAGAIVGGLPVLAVCIAAGAVMALSANASPVLVGIVVVGLTIDAYVFGILRGLGRFRLLVTYRVAANVVQLAVILLLAALGALDVPVAVLAYATSYSLPIIAIHLRTRAFTPALSDLGRPDRSTLTSLAAFAVPAAVSGLAYAMLLGLDVYLVRLLAPDELAVYGAARSLALPVSLGSFAVAVVLLPRTAAAAPATRNLLLGRAVLLTTAIAAVGFAGAYLLGPWVVALVYPPRMAGAAALVGPLAGAIGLMGVYSAVSQWWMGLGRPLAPAAALSLGATGGGITMLVLIPVLGALGAVAGLVVGELIALAAIAPWTVRRVRMTASQEGQRPSNT